MSIIAGMELLLLIPAILFSAIIAYAFVRPICPKFTVRQLMSPSALKSVARELGGECAAVWRGRGISGRKQFNKLKKTIVRISEKPKDMLTGWEKLLLSRSDELFDITETAQKYLRRSYLLGHVNGYPRLYLLCSLIVGGTRASFDGPLLGDVLCTFESETPLSDAEKRGLNNMLDFCLISFIAEIAYDALSREDSYECGVYDGALDSVSIDRIDDADYVCGLFERFKDKRALCRLLEDNGISADKMSELRRAALSEAYADIASALNSLTGRTDASDAQAVFFGGEAEAVCNMYAANELTMSCDDRGSIRIGGKSMTDIRFRCVCDKLSISSYECDGAFLRDRCIYRAFTDSIELSAELVLPPAHGGAFCKFTLINRTAAKLVCDIALSCDVRGSKSATTYKNGIIAGDVAIYMADPDCGFDENTGAITAISRVELDGFKSGSILCGVFMGDSAAFRQRFSYTCEPYYARALLAAREYYRDNALPQNERCDIEKLFCNVAPPMYPKYADVEACIENAMPPGACGLLCDGRLCAEVYASGDSEDAVDGIALTAPRYGLPKVFIVLEEEGVIWSAYGKCARGRTAARFNKGFCEFTSGYNGCVFTVKRYLYGEKFGEIFDVSVKNAVAAPRDIKCMFSVFPADGRNDISVLSSEPVYDTASYAEGYYSHGRIKRTSDFAVGGTTPARTITVKLKLKPKKTARAIFAFTLNSEPSHIEYIDAKIADECLKNAREYYSELSLLRLDTSERILNDAYDTALYTAHCRLLSDRSRASKALMECFAVKYADPALVKDTVTELCARQEISGRVPDADGLYATLLLPLVVKDISYFLGDNELFYKKAPFNGEKRCATVLEHCLRALDHATVCMAYDKNRIAYAGLYNAAIRSLMSMIPPERGKAYYATASRLRESILKGREMIRTRGAGGGVYAAIAAHLYYDDFEYDIAYGFLKKLAENNLLYSADGALSSIFVTAVTEKLLGVSVHGDIAVISPRTSDNAPDIRFSIGRGKNRTEIAVDNSEPSGSWHMNIDRISYFTNKLNINDGGSTVIFKRSG